MNEQQPVMRDDYESAAETVRAQRLDEAWLEVGLDRALTAAQAGRVREVHAALTARHGRTVADAAVLDAAGWR